MQIKKDPTCSNFIEIWTKAQAPENRGLDHFLYIVDEMAKLPLKPATEFTYAFGCIKEERKSLEGKLRTIDILKSHIMLLRVMLNRKDKEALRNNLDIDSEYFIKSRTVNFMIIEFLNYTTHQVVLASPSIKDFEDRAVFIKLQVQNLPSTE